jgi:hypothetical protein
VVVPVLPTVSRVRCHLPEVWIDAHPFLSISTSVYPLRSHAICENKPCIL